VSRDFAQWLLYAAQAPHLFELQSHAWHFDVLCAKTFLDLFMKWRVDSAVQEDPASALAFVSREVKGVL